VTLRGGGRPRDRGPQAHPLDGSDALPSPRVVGPPVRRAPIAADQGPSHGSSLRGLAFTLGGAILVLALLGFVVVPTVTGAAGDWAVANPAAWRLPVLGDLAGERLAPQLAEKASSDPSAVEWDVRSGDTVDTIADRLLADGLIVSKPAFLYSAYQQGLASKLFAGTFALRHDMTPPQVVQALISGRIVHPTVNVTFREGLRLEQMTAKLETIQSKVDPKAFYDLAMHPTPELLADYPWLQLPAGHSLEGYLYPATFTIRTDQTTAEDLIRMMLGAFQANVGSDLMKVPAARGLTFYQVLTLASIVEQEAKLDSERPLIAGVYQNRLDPRMWPLGLMQSDPTIFYVNDTLNLAKLPFDQWQQYVFWDKLKQKLPVPLPTALAGYNTYTSKGLPPGPICSPALASIEAALHPDTSTGYLYFIAKNDGSGTSAFAKTKAEHDANVKKYGGG
jgi:peptidoglycan lytic transglycosylase G